MDNSIGGVAFLLYRLLAGETLEEGGRQALELYFSRFASFAAGGDGAQQWLAQYRQLPDAGQLRLRWQPHFDGGVRLSAEQGEAFIRDFLQLGSQLQKSAGGDRGLYCGETVTEQNNVIDFVTAHRGVAAGQGQWIFHYGIEGQCLLSGEQQRLIGPGQLLLLPPGYDCDYQRAPACSRWVHRWLRFSPPPEWLAWSPALRRPAELLLLPLSPDTGSRVAGVFSELLSLSRRDSDIASRMMQNCAEYLLLLSAELAGEGAEPRGDESPRLDLDPRVQQAAAYLLAHYGEDFGVEQLAEHCHLSAARLAALFRQQLGLPPMQWRDQLRIREACRRLLASTEPVAAVAAAVGYGDPLHFSRRFRQLVGVSPSDYRKRRAQ